MAEMFCTLGVVLEVVGAYVKEGAVRMWASAGATHSQLTYACAGADSANACNGHVQSEFS